MSRRNELLAQAKAKGTALGAELEREFRALRDHRAFGLNFERHTPKTVELPGRSVRMPLVATLRPQPDIETDSRSVPE